MPLRSACPTTSRVPTGRACMFVIYRLVDLTLLFSSSPQVVVAVFSVGVNEGSPQSSTTSMHCVPHPNHVHLRKGRAPYVAPCPLRKSDEATSFAIACCCCCLRNKLRKGPGRSFSTCAGLLLRRW